MSAWRSTVSDGLEGDAAAVPLEPLDRTTFKRRMAPPPQPRRRAWPWPSRAPRGSRAQHLSAEDADLERVLAGAEGRAYIPPLFPSHGSYGIPFVVVCCVLFGEFLCAGVGGPFMFFMLADLGSLAPGQVGLWVGIVSSVFFLAQFVTSMMWARLAARHGRRAVLAGSLAGSALATVAFGASSSLPAVLVTRFAQGVFNGAVGVARATVIDIIHPAQEAHVYALLGVCWSLGGSAGCVID